MDNTEPVRLRIRDRSGFGRRDVCRPGVRGFKKIRRCNRLTFRSKLYGRIFSRQDQKLPLTKTHDKCGRPGYVTFDRAVSSLVLECETEPIRGSLGLPAAHRCALSQRAGLVKKSH